ncbi:MAG: tetratricopeptide repeat protein [Paenibacillus macerans]|uniref:Tetratricopeptide repeat protein n=1 Tax=Paenibacillus macerans TaxID=44252 RepID=A0A6N8EUA9_PAEMA|nr:tetratricopeptide repeat protein [Paenibacillus macerans]MBS5914862.1 helix-turn-helix transcriptional regulator [Paenibacillus macerans]MDU5947710.1 tetratricopeptide repeat protein [Paenibacillus macerans]MDU7477344.1 tetratricopeptide repeat protein [Paenibacillus macerans]MEC0137874.1 tetratricopeptide repeat protein [Paenibacillus macerans]MEC0329620.1 tetratricopeptide repeat protein [Paenibacillus macerans]
MEENLGALIRELRISLRMSQHALAEGICTQAFISKVETGMVIPSLEIAFKIGQKLNIPLDYILEKLQYPSFDHYQELNYQINRLLRERNYEEIYELVKAEKKNRQMARNIPFKQLLLWLDGICHYYILKDYEASIALFEQALDLTANPYTHSEREIEIINSMGIIYCEHGNYDDALAMLMKATEYVNKRIVLKEKTLKIKVLYNTAKVLAKLERYEESNCLCDQAVQLCRDYEISYLLGELYYQLGYNHEHLKEWSATLDYFDRSARIFELQQNELFLEQAVKRLKNIQSLNSGG